MTSIKTGAHVGFPAAPDLIVGVKQGLTDVGEAATSLHGVQLDEQHPFIRVGGNVSTSALFYLHLGSLDCSQIQLSVLEIITNNA